MSMQTGYSLTHREIGPRTGRHMLGWLPFLGGLFAVTVGSLLAVGAILH